MNWRRAFIPLALAAYAVVALTRYDWVRGERGWLPEVFPVSSMPMFWRVPNRPPVHARLGHIRRGGS